MYIRFETRSGCRVAGVVVEDIGHALLIRVERSTHRRLRGRTMLFPKNDMLNCIRDVKPIAEAA